MNDSKKYRAVVIGCGKVGATFEFVPGMRKPASHASALAAHREVELIALVDPDPTQLKQAGDYYKVPTYQDPEKCLEDLRPDIVSIATPPGTHEAALAMALKLDIPVIICEKPISDTLESAKRMTQMAKNSKSTVIINHQRRFFPLFKEARERIAAGELGDIEQITAYYSNGLFNNGTHVVDLLQFLLDDKASWAVGVENTKNTTAPLGGNNVDGLLGFSKGAVAALQSLDNSFYTIHDLRVYGTKGSLIITQFVSSYEFRFHWVKLLESVTIPGLKELDWGHADTKSDVYSMLEFTVAHAVDCLNTKVASGSTLEDGYHALQMLEGLQRSAQQDGKRVSI